MAENLPQRVSFQTKDGEVLQGYMFRPEGKGPFPAVVALHGCGGLFRKNGDLIARHLDWAHRLVRWGFVAFFPDSFGSRGLGSQCKTVDRDVKQRQRVLDARAAQKWLESQNFINPKDISLMGWSNGGGTVLRLAYSKKASGFKQAIAFYPGCRALLKKQDLKLQMPLSILMGEADDWTPAAPCIEMTKRFGGDIILYKHAYHGFDAPHSKLRQRKGLAFTEDGEGTAHVGTNLPARRHAIRKVKELLGVRE